MTVNNTMASYFSDKFGMGLVTAGTIASCFGSTNLFARALGGMLSDSLWATRLKVRVGGYKYLRLALDHPPQGACERVHILKTP